MNEYRNKIYFTSGADNRLYQVTSSHGQWQPEQIVYEHSAPIRDIEQVMHLGLPHDVYVSAASGNTVPGQVYKVVDDVPQSVFTTRTRPVSGLTWVRGAEPDGALHCVNLTDQISRVDLTLGFRSVVFSSHLPAAYSGIDTQGVEAANPTPTPSATSDATLTPSPTPPPNRTPSSTPTHTSTATSTRTPTATATGQPLSSTLNIAAETGLGVELPGLRVLIDINGARELVQTPFTRQLIAGDKVHITEPMRVSPGSEQLNFLRWRLTDGTTVDSNPVGVVLLHPATNIAALYRRAVPTETPGAVTPGTNTPTASATTTGTPNGSTPPVVTPTPTDSAEPPKVRTYLPIAAMHWAEK